MIEYTLSNDDVRFYSIANGATKKSKEIHKKINKTMETETIKQAILGRKLTLQQQGYIKELQEPKWTDDDLLEFVESYYIYDDFEPNRKKFYKDALNNFKKFKQ